MIPWRRALTAVSFLFFVTLAVRAGAAQEHPISLSWQAPDTCPSRAAVLQEIDRLLGGGQRTNGRQRFVARAQVTRAGDGRFELMLRTESPDGEGERALSAPTCEALAGAAALVIALGFDPAAVATEAAAASSAGPPSSSPVAPAPTLPPRAPPSSVQPAATAPVLPAAPPSSMAKPAASRERFGLGAGAGLGLDVGALDGPVAVIRAWATLFVARHRFDAALSYVPTTPIAAPDRATAGGRFTLVAGAASACLALLSWTRATAAACAGLELGQISAKGYGVTRPREGEALWIAPQAKLDLTFVLASPLALRLDAGAEAPLGRRPFVLENVGVVHEPSPLVGRAGLGAEIHF
ncbi:hypothetical protein [Sorangium sp. So ce1097]|uniref:hypothetical protein n=1 Tax=Sorangium sp. So ce1097 TaxID=3133330 RepID=UPI003F61DA5E